MIVVINLRLFYYFVLFVGKFIKQLIDYQLQY